MTRTPYTATVTDEATGELLHTTATKYASNTARDAAYVYVRTLARATREAFTIEHKQAERTGTGVRVPLTGERTGRRLIVETRGKEIA